MTIWRIELPIGWVLDWQGDPMVLPDPTQELPGIRVWRMRNTERWAWETFQDVDGASERGEGDFPFWKDAVASACRSTTRPLYWPPDEPHPLPVNGEVRATFISRQALPSGTSLCALRGKAPVYLHAVNEGDTCWLEMATAAAGDRVSLSGPTDEVIAALEGALRLLRRVSVPEDSARQARLRADARREARTVLREVLQTDDLGTLRAVGERLKGLRISGPAGYAEPNPEWTPPTVADEEMEC